VLVGMNDATSLISIKGGTGARGLRFAEHSDAVLGTNEEFVARVKGLLEVCATKEGRVISSANKERIKACIVSMHSVVDGLTELMALSDPPAKVDQVQMRRLHAAFLKTISNTS